MIKKENLEITSAWPFVEAKKMLRERKKFIEKKRKITLASSVMLTPSLHYNFFACCVIFYYITLTERHK